MNTTRSTKLKVLAQALGIAAAAVLGVLAGGGTAAADGHNVVNPDGTWGAADGPERRGVDWKPAVQSYDTSSDSPHASAPASSYPKASSYPGGSYPAGGSWPGDGFGVADN